MNEAYKLVCVGFGAGIGFMLAQEVFWFMTGIAGICHG